MADTTRTWDSPAGYGTVTRALHWGMAALFLWQFASAALRVAVSGRQPAARSLDRRPACRYATHGHLATGHDNVARANRVDRP